MVFLCHPIELTVQQELMVTRTTNFFSLTNICNNSNCKDLNSSRHYYFLNVDLLVFTNSCYNSSACLLIHYCNDCYFSINFGCSISSTLGQGKYVFQGFLLTKE